MWMRHSGCADSQEIPLASDGGSLKVFFNKGSRPSDSPSEDCG